MTRQVSTYILVVGLLFAALAVFNGCTNKQIFIPDPGPPPVDTNLVSFSADIIPIFNADCNSSTCHSGSVPPDLTPANAYDALWDGGYIDTMMAEESELYQWMLGNRGLPMPLSGPNSEYNAAVFNWIAQGAQDN